MIELNKFISYLKNKFLKITVNESNIKNIEDKEIYIKFIEQVIKYILNLRKQKVEETNIYILIKKYDSKYINLIVKLAQISKSLNVITPELERFENIEKNIYSKYGISLIIANNKRKSLIKANYIINIDFLEKDINKYNIYRNSIIFNISENKIKKLRGFNGNIINNINYISEKIKIIDLVGNNGNINIKNIKNE